MQVSQGTAFGPVSHIKALAKILEELVLPEPLNPLNK